MSNDDLDVGAPARELAASVVAICILGSVLILVIAVALGG